MPSRLGPAPYGLTSPHVDMRQKAVDDLVAYMGAYFSAVDGLREATDRTAACAVVHSERLRGDGAASVAPLQKHQELMEGVQLPPKRGERPVVPPDPYAKKPKRSKKA